MIRISLQRRSSAAPSNGVSDYFLSQWKLAGARVIETVVHVQNFEASHCPRVESVNRSLLSHSDIEKSVRGRFRDQELSLPFHYYGQFSVGHAKAEQDCVEAFLKILRDEVEDAPAIRIGIAERVIAV